MVDNMFSGPIIAGYVYDVTGSYRIGFVITAVLAAGGSLFFVMAPRPMHPIDRARAHAAEAVPPA